jgi:hypothetical protein
LFGRFKLGFEKAEVQNLDFGIRDLVTAFCLGHGNLISLAELRISLSVSFFKLHLSSFYLAWMAANLP